MIEVVLDFQGIATQEKLVLYVREKLGLPFENRLGKWDAFIDDFRTLKVAEYEEYNPIRDEWKNIEEWERYKREDAQYGLKNERGVRDDLLLIFVNFRTFYLSNKGLATTFLEIIFEEIEEINTLSTYEDGSDILDIQILMKS